MNVTHEAVRDALSYVIEPELHQDLITLDFVRDIRVDGKDVRFTIMLTTPACPMKDVIKTESEREVRNRVPGVGKVEINFDSEVRKDRRIAEKIPVPISNIVAVSSGKGGVGKTTVSVNLALSLAADGAKTGILDADIYGPNVPVMLGVAHADGQKNEKIIPAAAHGLQVMSMGFLIPEGEALVWRGPMLHSAISQLFTEVAWDELDYLIVDLPPGTGDVPLSLAQALPLAGAVIVCTPQRVAQDDARRAVRMFEELGVPIVGVVENMSWFVADDGIEYDLFGRGGAEQMATDMAIPFLGPLPLHIAMRQNADAGTPLGNLEISDDITAAIDHLAGELARQVAFRAASSEQPTISVN